MFTGEKKSFRKGILVGLVLVLASFCLLVKFTYSTGASVESEEGKTVVSSDEEIAEEVLITEYPRIVKYRTGTPSRPVVTFTVENNTGHSISKFSLKFTVKKLYEGISFAEIATSCDEGCDEIFDKSYKETDEEIVYVFSLKENVEFPKEQKVNLVCVYEDEFGYAVELEPLIEPKPYDYADRNYDRINDMLALEVAMILMMGPEERADVSVIVTLNHPVTQADLDIFESKGGSIKVHYMDGFAGDIPPDSFDEYINAARDSIKFVDPDLPVELYLDKATLNTRARVVWNTPYPFSSSGVRGDPKTSVAVIDTGIDDEHPAFGGWWSESPSERKSGYWDVTKIAWGDDPAGVPERFEPEIDEIIVDYDGDGIYDWDDDLINDGMTSGMDALSFTLLPSKEAWSYLANKKIIGWQDVFFNKLMPEDYHRHGSSCAGIIAGTGAGDPEGVYYGVAPDVKLVGVRALEISSAKFALPWINTNKEDYHIIAVSQSIGSSTNIPSWDEEAEKIVSEGLIFVQAAGNDFGEGIAIGSPGRVGKVLTVGAVNDDDKLAFYSSNGDNPRVLKPDVVASGGSGYLSRDNQGIGIMSAFSNDVSWQFDIYNEYIEGKGTSYSVPHVAGEVALIVDAITDYEGIDSDKDGKINEDPWNGVNDDGDFWADDPAGEPDMYEPGIDEVFIDVNKNNCYDKGVDKVLFTGKTDGIDTSDGASIFPLIDEDLAPWPYTEEEALKVKSIVCMTSFEVHGGEVVPEGFLNKGISNAPRDSNDDGRVDKFDRGREDKYGYYGKDRKEGYGRVCIDAAIEAVTKNWNMGSELTDEFGPNPWDKKVFVRRLHVGKITEQPAPRKYSFKLEVPPEADYDLYIYDGGNPLYMRRPYSEGDPRVIAKSTNEGLDVDEGVSFKALPFTETYYLVVKWVDGEGKFTLSRIEPPEVETP